MDSATVLISKMSSWPRFVRNVSCSPWDFWFISNSVVVQSFESFFSCSSRLFCLCCWLLAAISSFFVSLNSSNVFLYLTLPLLQPQCCCSSPQETASRHSALHRSDWHTAGNTRWFLGTVRKMTTHSPCGSEHFALDKSKKMCLVFFGTIRMMLEIVIAPNSPCPQLLLCWPLDIPPTVSRKSLSHRENLDLLQCPSQTCQSLL